MESPEAGKVSPTTCFGAPSPLHSVLSAFSYLPLSMASSPSPSPTCWYKALLLSPLTAKSSQAVEFREVFSGDTGYAWAEAPKEALPLDCRPNFGVAWLTKDKFKVNEIYNCKYTPGNPKVDIHSDSIFDCRSENSSMAEMIKRCWIIFSGIINSAPASGAVRFLYKGLASGFVSGIVS